MANKDIGATLEYHEATKHSELSVRTSHHHLDMGNKPLAFKIYPKLAAIPLPRNFPQPNLDALTSISALGPVHRSTSLNVETLAEILFYSAGITRELRYPFGTYHMRAAPATGALYPIELYVICGDLEGLEAGVYHFGPGDFSLTELRPGDHRGELSEASGENSGILSAPATIVFTSFAWRNAWKYQARSYRHWYWDSGVIAANFLATAFATGLDSKLIMAFDDARVNNLICLMNKQEAVVAIAPIGIGLGRPPETKPQRTQVLDHKVIPLSKTEIDYPEIWRMHEASSLSSNVEVNAWIEGVSSVKRHAGVATHPRYPLHPFKDLPKDSSLRDVILRRGSTRRFSRAPISFEQLSTILHCSTQGVPADFLARTGDTLVEVYLTANAVESLPPGAYFLDHATKSLEQLKRGELRSVSGYLCLEQGLFADASVVIFLMTNLQHVLKRYGNRGYRVSQFEAGVIAGKIYLSAYALGIGASGTTFYDDAVTEFFSPHSEDLSPMMALGVGIPDYKANPGKVLVGNLSRAQLLSER